MKPTLNSDLGEGFGLHSFGNDAELMKLIDVANVACGYHAGDPNTMRETITLAADNGVAVGAHPSLPDLVGFGRRRMVLSGDDARNLILYQTGALTGFLKAEGLELNHIKPHGALYGMLAEDEALMQAAADVCELYQVPFFGMTGTAHHKVCMERGIPFVAELYVDLDYDDEGGLLIQKHPIPKTPELIVERLSAALDTSTITSVNGVGLPMEFDSVCIHSDGANSVATAAACRQVLDAAEG